MADAVMSVVILKYGIQRSCLYYIKIKQSENVNALHSVMIPFDREPLKITQLTSICLLLKTLLMLELNDAPENMEVTG